MTTKTFKVPNISCAHCVRTIEMELAELDGVTTVKADETSKLVTVEWAEGQTWQGITDLLEEINYPAET